MKSSHSPLLGPEPREEAIQAAVRASVRAYHRREDARPLSQWDFLIQQSRFLQKRWWLLQGGVLLLLWWLLWVSDTSWELQRAMGTLAPLFVVLVLPELWKNRSSGALEVECSAYYSLRQIYAARLLLFGLADLVLVTVFFAAALLTGRTTAWEMIVHFLLPFLVTGGICLQTLSCRRDYGLYAALPLSLLWAAVWVQIILNERVYQLLTLPMWLGMLLLAGAYFLCSLWKLQRTCEKIWEVSPSWN